MASGAVYPNGQRRGCFSGACLEKKWDRFERGIAGKGDKFLPRYLGVPESCRCRRNGTVVK